MNKFGEIVFGLFLIWMAWIFIGGTGQQKLDRACRFNEWTGNLVTSLAELSFPSTTKQVQYFWQRIDYGCEYTLWRLIYEDDYKAAVAAQEAAAVPVAGGAPSAQQGTQASAQAEDGMQGLTPPAPVWEGTPSGELP